MKNLYTLFVLFSIITLSAITVSAQTVSIKTQPTPNPVHLGQTFDVGVKLSNTSGGPITVGSIDFQPFTLFSGTGGTLTGPFANLGTAQFPIAPTGNNDIAYIFQAPFPAGTTNKSNNDLTGTYANNDSNTAHILFTLNKAPTSGNLIEGSTYTGKVFANYSLGNTYNPGANVTTNIGTFQFTVATPELGSVISLSGLLIAGGTGLWFQRRRRKNTNDAK